jgi:arsenical pump membrane protein
VWACSGALVLVLSGLLPFSQAGHAIAKGTDVYLFLTGMMLLSELARRAGVFDWLASLAVTAAKGSRARLFSLIYLVGIFVTVFLSNDATAVVLTPAVYAAVQKAQTKALPYLFICAFIANAASFVLPIANPANLVVYGKQLPPLALWLRTFFLPSLCSIVATFVALRWLVRKDLQGRIEDGSQAAKLSREGRLAAWGIVGTGAVLICASGFGLDLGLPTCISAVIAVLIATHAKGDALTGIVKDVSWSVLPLVAGLFVLVEALNCVGALRDVASMLQWCAGMPKIAGGLTASFGIAILSNVMNNLPSGLLAGGALQSMHAPPFIRDSVLIGVDLGPNLSVTGSLATVLWLIALRREGEHITAWEFLKVGLIIMAPALFLSTLAVALLSK